MPAILVLDDQATSRQLIRKVLENADSTASIIDFADGAAALSWLATEAVDLVLSDYSMPGVDGLAFTRQFRRLPQHRDVPLIFVTISDEHSVRLEALEAGATDFLNKPVDHFELQARCKNLLKLRRYQLNLKERAATLEDNLATTRAMIDERERDTVHTVATMLEWSSVTTPGRQRRVAQVSEIIGMRLGFDQDNGSSLGIAALLHDTGKIATQDQTQPRADLIRQESQAGYEVLRSSLSRYARRAADIARDINEHFDGSGGPSGKSGNDIELDARIVSLAVRVDQRLSNQGDRPASTLDQLWQWLDEQSGITFDPLCVDALRRENTRLRDLYAA